LEACQPFYMIIPGRALFFNFGFQIHSIVTPAILGMLAFNRFAAFTPKIPRILAKSDPKQT